MKDLLRIVISWRIYNLGVSNIIFINKDKGIMIRGNKGVLNNKIKFIGVYNTIWRENNQVNFQRNNNQDLLLYRNIN
jgi:hypothetical protein